VNLPARRALVTGANGFIGHPCLAALVARGYEVHAVWSRTPPEKTAGVCWHQTDLLDPKQVVALAGDVRATHCLHLAWHVPPGAFWTSPENHRWVEASLELWRGFVSSGGRRFVVAGSCNEYDWTSGVCFEAMTPLRPASVYGQCKHALAERLATLSAAAGIEHAWGRIFHLYGPREHPDRFVPTVIRSLLTGQPVSCRSPKALRDLLYVDDVADAFVSLLDSHVVGALNIASGSAVTLGDVVHRIGARLDRPVQLTVPEATDDGAPDHLIADNGRLTHEVGWRPRYDLDAGLDRTIAWWQSHLAPEPRS
jgi:nucleoside-diphosphate-sugar epimerase